MWISEVMAISGVTGSIKKSCVVMGSCAYLNVRKQLRHENCGHVSRKDLGCEAKGSRKVIESNEKVGEN